MQRGQYRTVQEVENTPKTGYTAITLRDEVVAQLDAIAEKLGKNRQQTILELCQKYHKEEGST